VTKRIPSLDTWGRHKARERYKFADGGDVGGNEGPYGKEEGYQTHRGYISPIGTSGKPDRDGGE
jgi:hypothetical protein